MKLLKLVVFTVTLTVCYSVFSKQIPTNYLQYQVIEQEEKPSKQERPMERRIKPGKQKYIAQLDREKVAIAITKIYRHVTYKQALKIVNTTYRHAKHHDIKPMLALSIIAVESSFNKTAKSNKGAMGYTQVKIDKHLDKLKNGDIYDTDTNIRIGMEILGDCFKKHNEVQKSLGCYYGTQNPKHTTEYAFKIINRNRQLTQLALQEEN